MDGNEMMSMIRGYAAGNLIAANTANKLSKQAAAANQQLAELEEKRKMCPWDEDIAPIVAGYVLNKDIDAAERFLSETWVKDVIYLATHQKPTTLSLDALLGNARKKYERFFSQIDRPAPESLVGMTAAELCRLVEVQEMPAMSEEEYQVYLKELHCEDDPTWPIFAIIVVILVVIALVAIIM